MQLKRLIIFINQAYFNFLDIKMTAQNEQSLKFNLKKKKLRYLAGPLSILNQNEEFVGSPLSFASKISLGKSKV